MRAILHDQKPDKQNNQLSESDDLILYIVYFRKCSDCRAREICVWESETVKVVEGRWLKSSKQRTAATVMTIVNKIFIGLFLHFTWMTSASQPTGAAPTVQWEFVDYIHLHRWNPSHNADDVMEFLFW